MHTVWKSNVTGTNRAYKTIGKSEAIPVDKQQHAIIYTINTQQLHSSHSQRERTVDRSGVKSSPHILYTAPVYLDTQPQSLSFNFLLHFSVTPQDTLIRQLPIFLI